MGIREDRHEFSVRQGVSDRAMGREETVKPLTKFDKLKTNTVDWEHTDLVEPYTGSAKPQKPIFNPTAEAIASEIAALPSTHTLVEQARQHEAEQARLADSEKAGYVVGPEEEMVRGKGFVITRLASGTIVTTLTGPSE
jgi:hypothetical protein